MKIRNYAYKIYNETESFIILVDIGDEFRTQRIKKAKATLENSKAVFVGIVKDLDEEYEEEDMSDLTGIGGYDAGEFYK